MTKRFATFKPTKNGILDGCEMEVRGDVIEADAKYPRRYEVMFLSGFLVGCTSVVDEADLDFTTEPTR